MTGIAWIDVRRVLVRVYLGQNDVQWDADVELNTDSYFLVAGMLVAKLETDFSQEMSCVAGWL